MVKKSRGAIALGKTQVNWRIRTDLLERMDTEAKENGIVDRRGKPKKAALLEYILQCRYYPEFSCYPTEEFYNKLKARYGVK